MVKAMAVVEQLDYFTASMRAAATLYSPVLVTLSKAELVSLLAEASAKWKGIQPQTPKTFASLLSGPDDPAR